MRFFNIFFAEKDLSKIHKKLNTKSRFYTIATYMAHHFYVKGHSTGTLP
jgi:hypothetical protein